MHVGAGPMPSYIPGILKACNSLWVRTPSSHASSISSSASSSMHDPSSPPPPFQAQAVLSWRAQLREAVRGGARRPPDLPCLLLSSSVFLSGSSSGRECGLSPGGPDPEKLPGSKLLGPYAATACKQGQLVERTRPSIVVENGHHKSP